jgi:hypothetical protein
MIRPDMRPHIPLERILSEPARSRDSRWMAFLRFLLNFVVISISVFAGMLLFGLLVNQFIEPLPWLRFLVTVSVLSILALLFSFWWRVDVLGCASAWRRWSQRSAERHRRLLTSRAHRMFCLISSLIVLSHSVSNLREEIALNSGKHSPPPAASIEHKGAVTNGVDRIPGRHAR